MGASDLFSFFRFDTKLELKIDSFLPIFYSTTEA